MPFVVSPATLGTELGYAEATADLSTSSTTFVDVTGITTTVTIGTRPVRIVFHAPLVTHDNATGAVVARIVRDSTAVGGEAWVKTGVANSGTMFHHEARDNPTAGSHTYKVQYEVATAGSAFLWGATFNEKYWIEVIEV